ncbi:MAG TPA: hypothetical protein PLC55_14710 [Zoogloea sp.]|nr:hypothetical protein [Zoogloea sp.]
MGRISGDDDGGRKPTDESSPQTQYLAGLDFANNSKEPPKKTPSATVPGHGASFIAGLDHETPSLSNNDLGNEGTDAGRMPPAIDDEHGGNDDGWFSSSFNKADFSIDAQWDTDGTTNWCVISRITDEDGYCHAGIVGGYTGGGDYQVERFSFVIDEDSGEMATLVFHEQGNLNVITGEEGDDLAPDPIAEEAANDASALFWYLHDQDTWENYELGLRSEKLEELLTLSEEPDNPFVQRTQDGGHDFLEIHSDHVDGTSDEEMKVMGALGFTRAPTLPIGDDDPDDEEDGDEKEQDDDDADPTGEEPPTLTTRETDKPNTTRVFQQQHSTAHEAVTPTPPPAPIHPVHVTVAAPPHKPTNWIALVIVAGLIMVGLMYAWHSLVAPPAAPEPSDIGQAATPAPTIAPDVATPPVVSAPLAPEPGASEPQDTLKATSNPSFDCAKAATLVENTICGDAILGELDRTLAEKFQRMREAGIGGDILTTTQRMWTKDRDQCTDGSCIADAYRNRLRALDEYMVGKAKTGEAGTSDAATAPPDTVKLISVIHDGGSMKARCSSLGEVANGECTVIGGSDKFTLMWPDASTHWYQWGPDGQTLIDVTGGNRECCYQLKRDDKGLAIIKDGEEVVRLW